MTTTLDERCRMKKGLFRCSGTPAGVCQYCGRPFCSDHGVKLEDGQEICTRKPCTAKQEDVQRHLQYRAMVQHRNSELLCGLHSCVEAIGGQCSRCKGYFCAKHVRNRDEMYLQNGVRTMRTASLCQHCHARRPIWVRT